MEEIALNQQEIESETSQSMKKITAYKKQNLAVIEAENIKNLA